MYKITKDMEVCRGSLTNISTQFYFTDKKKKLAFEFESQSSSTLICNTDLFEISYKFDFKTKGRILNLTNKDTEEKKTINVEFPVGDEVWFRFCDHDQNFKGAAMKDKISKEFKRNCDKDVLFFDIFFKGKIVYSCITALGREFVLIEKYSRKTVAFARLARKRGCMNPQLILEIGENIHLCLILTIFLSFYSKKVK